MTNTNNKIHIVSGATGQVGSAVVGALLEQDKSVKAIIRHPEKSDDLKSRGVDVEIADLFDLKAIKKAFYGGDTVFLLTPENPFSDNILADTERIIKNYREAIQHSGISRVVGLSSLGAQHPSGTGNLEMSYMLEHALEGLPVEQVFIRPAYYYSNWMGYLELVKETGVLPTFFPADLKIPMAAPTDVAGYIAQTMMGETGEENVHELVGPELYSSNDVARIFGQKLNRTVEAESIPRVEWKETLQQAGFSGNAADNLMKMTKAVIEGKTVPEKEKQDLVKLPTTLEKYLEDIVAR